MLSLEQLTGSPHLSFSSLESWLTCGEKYRLTKVVGAEQGQAWYLLGGSAVHEATEMLDKGETDSPEIAWQQAWEKQTATIEDPSTVRAGGRASKEFPLKENGTWWAIHGSQMVHAWTRWRDSRLRAGWTILEVEHPFEVELGGVPVRGFIDRVMADPNGQVHVVDLKTGSHAPSSALQLGIYSIGYAATTGVTPTVGSYWMARKSDSTPDESLVKYTPELVGDWFDKARTAIQAEVFVPHASGLCKSCTVADKCSLFTGVVFRP